MCMKLDVELKHIGCYTAVVTACGWPIEILAIVIFVTLIGWKQVKRRIYTL